MKKIVFGLLSVGLAAASVNLGSVSASAVPAPKVCYFDNPKELRYTINSGYWGGLGFVRSANSDTGPTFDVPNDVPLTSSKFSGSCPTNAQPSTSAGSPFYYFRDSLIPNSQITFGENYSYYKGGKKTYRTPLQSLIENQNGIRWTSPTGLYYGYELNVSPYLRAGGFNTKIDQREQSIYLNFNTIGYLPEFLNRWVTMQPTAANSVTVWTGNAATENCDYDAISCLGGYKFQKYVVLPKNPIKIKWKSLGTKISATAGKKSGKYFTATVNVDRLFTDAKGKDIKRYPGDKVTIMRGTKVVGKAKVNKAGVAKIRIKDIKGANTYTVSIPETNRNWDASTTFVK